MSEGENVLTAKGIQEILESDEGFTVTAGAPDYFGDDYTPAGWYELEEVLRNRYRGGKIYVDYEPVEIARIGKVTFVESVGGEGEGDHRHLVFRVQMVDGSDRLFRIDGYYSSYGGTEWDDSGEGLKEVRAQQKTITVYE